MAWLINGALSRSEDMPRHLVPVLGALSLWAAPLAPAKPMPTIAADSINRLGLELYRAQLPEAGPSGVLLSPYSISTALAMTYCGAEGETRAEMQRVLHFPADPGLTSGSFEALARQLTDVVRLSQQRVESLRRDGGDETPMQLNVANRLFVQNGYALRDAFVSRLRERFDAAPEQLDFRRNSAAAREHINAWVAQKTQDRIHDLLPAGQPSPDARVVLVNALYLKAAWENEFYAGATQSEPFHLPGGTRADVPTMRTTRSLGYEKRDGYSVVTVPYQTGRLQFVLVVPDAADGLAAVERTLTAENLASWKRLHATKVALHLPSFKLAPPTLSLARALKSLGLKSAFDRPRGSANFDGMAPRTPDAYFYIGEVFHRTWLSLDEHGTEATAATAVVMLAGTSVSLHPEPPPVEVRADRPFLFAIQHVDSGACLFLGRVMDPREE